MQTQQAAQAYAQVGLQSRAHSTSPHGLITMLFDAVQVALRKAEHAIDAGDIAARGMAISKAIDILERGLRAALDTSRGGELAERLDALYDYMVRRLIRANREADRGGINEVAVLLGDIASAWKQIGEVA